MKAAVADPAAEENSPILLHRVGGVTLVNHCSLEEKFCQCGIPQSLEVYQVFKNVLLHSEWNCILMEML